MLLRAARVACRHAAAFDAMLIATRFYAMRAMIYAMFFMLAFNMFIHTLSPAFFFFSLKHALMPLLLFAAATRRLFFCHIIAAAAIQIAAAMMPPMIRFAIDC